MLPDVQVTCIKLELEYIPPLWIMCLESVAHLLVMFNFSSNFLVYCCCSRQFKSALCQVFRKGVNNAASGPENPLER